MSVTIALAGNPNCGKTTMFNALTGANQYVGNWPGVTVEKKEGKLKNQKDVTVTDLPGIYSLSPYTLEEVVSRDYLLKEKPDVIIDLVDATNIERNLYLATQLLEIGIPVVIALNMVDLLKKNNIHINVKGLSSALGCPIVETSALKGTGLKEVVDEAIKCANQHRVPSKQMEFPKAVEKAVNEIEGLVPANISEENKRWYAVKLLERDSKVKEGLNLPASAQSRIEEIASELEKDPAGLNLPGSRPRNPVCIHLSYGHFQNKKAFYRIIHKIHKTDFAVFYIRIHSVHIVIGLFRNCFRKSTF